MLTASASLFREQPSQRCCLIAVEHAPSRGTFAAFPQSHDDAVQRLNILLRRLHARKDVAQIDEHGRALVERAKIFDLIEGLFEIGKKRLHLLLAGGLGFAPHAEGKSASADKLEPFVSDNGDR